MSRMPLTALIIDLNAFVARAPPCSGGLFAIDPGSLDVVLGVGAESLALFTGDLALYLGRNAHDHTLGRYLGAFRNDGSSGDHRALPYFRPIENDGADTDQAIVFYGAAMQHSEMPDRDAVTDV